MVEKEIETGQRKHTITMLVSFRPATYIARQFSFFPLVFHQDRQQCEAYLRNNEATRHTARQNLD